MVVYPSDGTYHYAAFAYYGTVPAETHLLQEGESASYTGACIKAEAAVFRSACKGE
jgi:hypothetical protein